MRYSASSGLVPGGCRASLTRNQYEFVYLRERKVTPTSFFRVFSSLLGCFHFPPHSCGSQSLSLPHAHTRAAAEAFRGAIHKMHGGERGRGEWKPSNGREQNECALVHFHGSLWGDVCEAKIPPQRTRLQPSLCSCVRHSHRRVPPNLSWK